MEQPEHTETQNPALDLGISHVPPVKRGRPIYYVNYTTEFKVAALRKQAASVMSLREGSEECQVNISTLSQWRSDRRLLALARLTYDSFPRKSCIGSTVPADSADTSVKEEEPLEPLNLVPPHQSMGRTVGPPLTARNGQMQNPYTQNVRTTSDEEDDGVDMIPADCIPRHCPECAHHIMDHVVALVTAKAARKQRELMGGR